MVLTRAIVVVGPWGTAKSEKHDSHKRLSENTVAVAVCFQVTTGSNRATSAFAHHLCCRHPNDLLGTLCYRGSMPDTRSLRLINPTAQQRAREWAPKPFKAAQLTAPRRSRTLHITLLSSKQLAPTGPRVETRSSTMRGRGDEAESRKGRVRKKVAERQKGRQEEDMKKGSNEETKKR